MERHPVNGYVVIFGSDYMSMDDFKKEYLHRFGKVAAYIGTDDMFADGGWQLHQFGKWLLEVGGIKEYRCYGPADECNCPECVFALDACSQCNN